MSPEAPAAAALPPPGRQQLHVDELELADPAPAPPPPQPVRVHLEHLDSVAGLDTDIYNRYGDVDT